MSTILSRTMKTGLLLGSVLVLSQCSLIHFSRDDLAFTDNPVADKFYKKGTTYMQQGFYEKAIPPLTDAIKTDEHYVAAFINRSLCYNKLKDYKNALEDAKSALQWNSGSSYAYYQKAQAEQGLGKYVDAAKDYQNAAQYEPENGYKYVENAAKCYELGGQKDIAKQLRTNLATSRDPNDLLSRGVAKYDKGLYTDAIKDLTDAINQEPREMLAYYNRGLCEATLDQYKEALADYDKAIALDPDYEQAYYLRGWDKFFMGDCVGSEEDFRHHVSINDVGEAHSPYSVIMCAMADRRLNNGGADPILKWWQPHEYDKWPEPILKYLRHEISAADVLAAATTNDMMTEAKAYLGLDCSLEGKKQEAIDNLTWVQNNGNRSFSEYQLAISELARLKTH